MQTLNNKTQALSLKWFKKVVESKATNSKPITLQKALNLNSNIVINNFVNFTTEDYKIAVEAITGKEVNIKQIQDGAFYKSWSKIANMTEEEFRTDQILHYISRYMLDIDAYRPEMKNKLVKDGAIKIESDFIEVNLFSFINSLEENKHNFNKYQGDIAIKVYDSISWNEFVTLVTDRLTSNIALDDRDIEDLFASDGVLSVFDVEILNYIYKNTKNKQIKMMLSISFNIVPSDAKEFLEVVTAIATSKVLFIKNKDTFEKIQERSFGDIKPLFVEFGKKNPNALIDLASIYNRNKGIFLSIKTMKDNNSNFNGLNLSNKNSFVVAGQKFKNHKHFVNKIAKLSKKHHKPYLTSEYLELTSNNFDLKSFRQIVEDMDISYIVKLANAFIVRLNMLKQNTNILQVLVRNGKEFYTEINLKLEKFYQDRLDIIKSLLEEKINKIILERKIVIKNLKNSVIKYAIPTSGKAFVYDIPFGSRVDFANALNIDKSNKKFVAGIYWENYNGKKSDWDLKARNDVSMVGWNADFRTQNLMYSGDVTDAPNGAAELLYSRNYQEPFAYTISIEAFDIPKVNSQHINELNFFVGFADKQDNLEYIENEDAKTLINKDSIISVKVKADGTRHARTNLGLLTEQSFVFQSTSNGFKTPADMPTKECFEAYKIKNSSYLLFEDLNLISFQPQNEEEESEVRVVDFENISQDDLLAFLQ